MRPKLPRRAERATSCARYSKATMTSRLTAEMIAGAKELLRLMGLPVVQAASEAEAQAAHMGRRGDVWAAASKDYDALLFGAPRLVRFLTISGREFLPAQQSFRPITSELIDVPRMLDALGITHLQLIDLGLLVGTDFHPASTASDLRRRWHSSSVTAQSSTCHRRFATRSSI